MTTKASTPSQTETPQGITEGQIGKIQELLSAALRKSGLPRGAVQTVIEDEGKELLTDLLVVVRNRAERHAEVIIRRVDVNRSRTPQQVVGDTGYVQYVDQKVLATMPVGGEGPDEVELHYFRLRRSVSNDQLAVEYRARGFVPDPQAQAADNKVEEDTAFADKHPNGTHWRLADGGWGFIAFNCYLDEHHLFVNRDGDDWDDRWWFGGRKFIWIDSSLNREEFF